MAATLQLPVVAPRVRRHRRASTCCSAEPRCAAARLRRRVCHARRSGHRAPVSGRCAAGGVCPACRGLTPDTCTRPPPAGDARPCDCARLWTPTSARPEAARVAQSLDRSPSLVSLSSTAAGQMTPVVARRGEEGPNPMVMERFQAVISNLFQQVRRGRAETCQPRHWPLRPAVRVPPKPLCVVAALPAAAALCARGACHVYTLCELTGCRVHLLCPCVRAHTLGSA